MNLASGWAPVFSIVMAAIANAGGSTLLKYSTSYRSAEGGKNAVFYLLFFGAMALFGGSFPFYAFGLSKMRLSVAQPIFTVGTYTAVALGAILLFREPYSATKIIGLVVIMVGVLLVSNG
jgi:multidrug transporter EmrE-like cation transporter